MNKASNDLTLVDQYNLYLSDSQLKKEYGKTKYQMNVFQPVKLGSKTKPCPNKRTTISMSCSQETRDITERDSGISINRDSVEVVSVDDSKFVPQKPLFKEENIIDGVESKAKFDKSKVC